MGTANSAPGDYPKLYDNLIRSTLNIETKGKTLPYTSLNGNMFSFLTADGSMGLRLSKADRDEFIREFDSKLIERFGKPMKEYVEVPAKLLAEAEKLKRYILLSYRYVATLPSKPTRKS